MRNYTIEPVFNEIEDKFQNKGIKAKFDYSSYDSALPELLRMNAKKLKEYDGILIFYHSKLLYQIFIKKN